MKKLLLISIFLLAGRAACGQASATPSLSTSPPSGARTLDLRAYINIGEIGKNYWGPGINPGSGTSCPTCHWNSSIGTEKDARELTYTNSTDTAISTFFGVGCGDGTAYGKADKGKGASPQSLLDSVVNQDTCAYNLGYSFAQFDEWQVSYDTLKTAVEKCPLAYQSYQAFRTLGGDVGNLEVYNNNSYNDSLWTHYRLWLESVLYLNTVDPEYFCQDVEQIAGSYAYSIPDSTPELLSKAANVGFAIYRWLILNTNCDDNLTELYSQGRQNQYKEWYNDSVAGIHFPLDTTLPTMHQLGLDTLLARHKLAVVPDQPVSIILNATASPNPVSTGTIITFGISQEAYVKIGLFDILGAPVSGGRVPGSGGEGFEGLFAPGNHEVPLSLQGIPSGTYFARILTAYGNVATVKLVKE